MGTYRHVHIGPATAQSAAKAVRIVEEAIGAEFKMPAALNPLRGNQVFRARVRDACILLQLPAGDEDEDT